MKSLSINEIKSLKEKMKSNLNFVFYNDVIKVFDELLEYRKLKENGMLPEFNLGDEVWSIRLGEILKSKIVMLQQKKDKTWIYRVSREISPGYHDTANYKENDFDKLFFLTKEAAEAALKEMG